MSRINLTKQLPINTHFKSNLFQNNIPKLVLNKQFFHGFKLQNYNLKNTFNKKFYCQTNQTNQTNQPKTNNILTRIHNLTNNQKILKIAYNANFITNMWLSCNIGNYVITQQHISLFGAIVTMSVIVPYGVISVLLYLDNLSRNQISDSDINFEAIRGFALIFIILIIMLFCYFEISFTESKTFIKILDKCTK